MTTATATERRPLAVPLDPHAILDEIRAAGITHVITVPDTHQKSLLALLADSDDPSLVTVCTEDEAFGVNLGLYAGGARPMLLVQNAGVFASMNSLRGLCLDPEVPAVLLVGEYFRDPAVPPEDSPHRVVNLLVPTLGAWGVAHRRLDHADDLPNIGAAVEEAFRTRGPQALLVGAPTAEVAAS